MKKTPNASFELESRSIDGKPRIFLDTDREQHEQLGYETLCYQWHNLQLVLGISVERYILT